MNPAYLEFLKAFSLLLIQTKNMSLHKSRAASTHFFTQNIVKESVYQVDNLIIPGVDGNNSYASPLT